MILSLLARMPHKIMKRGMILPLQTPQAFTTRAHRLRVPNQIPACTSKQGNATYRAGILKNIAKENASTTEGLPTLDSHQFKKVREKNEGKFFGNSRYIINDNGSSKTPPTMKKPKEQCENDTKSNAQQQIPMPSAWAFQSLKESSRHDENAHVCSKRTDLFEKEGDSYEAVLYPESVTGCRGQETLVPLFACIEDRGLALLENQNWSTPSAVISARREGNQQTREIGVYWYSSKIPRYVGWDGRVEEDIVDNNAMHLFLAREPIPGGDELVWQDNSANSFALDFVPSSISTAIKPSFDERRRESPQGFLSQSSADYPRTTTAALSSQIPLSAFNDIRRHQARSDNLEKVWGNQFGAPLGSKSLSAGLYHPE